jgi:hypothetical protein
VSPAPGHALAGAAPALQAFSRSAEASAEAWLRACAGALEAALKPSAASGTVPEALQTAWEAS